MCKGAELHSIIDGKSNDKYSVTKPSLDAVNVPEEAKHALGIQIPRPCSFGTRLLMSLGGPDQIGRKLRSQGINERRIGIDPSRSMIQ